MAQCMWPDCKDDALPAQMYCKTHRTVGAKGMQRSGRTRGGNSRGKTNPGDNRGRQNNPNRSSGDGNRNPAKPSGGSANRSTNGDKKA